MQHVQEWNNIRQECVDVAIKKMLVPELIKELHTRLLEEAKEFVLRSCARKVYNWIKVTKSVIFNIFLFLSCLTWSYTFWNFLSIKICMTNLSLNLSIYHIWICYKKNYNFFSHNVKYKKLMQLRHWYWKVSLFSRIATNENLLDKKNLECVLNKLWMQYFFSVKHIYSEFKTISKLNVTQN